VRELSGKDTARAVETYWGYYPMANGGSPLFLAIERSAHHFRDERKALLRLSVEPRFAAGEKKERRSGAGQNTEFSFV